MIQRCSALILCLVLLGSQSTCIKFYRNYYRVEVQTETEFLEWREVCRKHSPITYSKKETPWYDLAFFLTNAEVDRAYKLVHDNEGLLIKPQLANSRPHFEAWNIYYDKVLYYRFKYPVSPLNLTEKQRLLNRCSHLRSYYGKPMFINFDCFSKKALCMANKQINDSAVEKYDRLGLKYYYVSYDDKLSWEELQKRCKKYGGDVAIVKTLQDILWAQNVFRDTGIKRSLIGARKLNSSKMFVNVDGSALDVQRSLWDDTSAILEPDYTHTCVTIFYEEFTTIWYLKTGICKDFTMMCQYGLGACKYDIIPRKIARPYILKEISGTETEQECMEKCDKGCGKCVMSFSSSSTVKNCILASFSVEYYHLIDNKNAVFEFRQEFDSDWAALVPKLEKTIQPRPNALWPLDNVARGLNVMGPVDARHYDCSTENLKWTEAGPRGSKVKYPRSNGKSVRIQLGPKLGTTFTLAAWVKTDAFTQHGIPIFEGDHWQKSFSLLFAADQRNELHLDTHQGAFHTKKSSDDVSKWRHVAMVRNSSSDFEFFLNGKPLPLLYIAKLEKPLDFDMQSLCLFGTCDNIPMHGSLACVSYFNYALKSDAITRMMTLCP